MLWNTIHVDTISTMCHNGTSSFVMMMCQLSFKIPKAHPIHIWVELWKKIQLTFYGSNTSTHPLNGQYTQGRIKNAQSPIVISNYYFSNFFWSLWVWKESNHACFVPIEIHNANTHFVPTNTLQQSWMKRLMTIIHQLLKQYWNMQPINYTYNIKNSMKCFKLVCQNLKLAFISKSQVSMVILLAKMSEECTNILFIYNYRKKVMKYIYIYI